MADYYVRRVSKQRVTRGRTLYAEHRDLLTRLQREYGVPAQHLLSFLGLESNYGSFFGKIPDNCLLPSCVKMLKTTGPLRGTR